MAEEEPAAGEDLLQFLLVDVGIGENLAVRHGAVVMHQVACQGCHSCPPVVIAHLALGAL